MTNYRMNVCEVHDLPQLHFCFDCGAALEMYVFTDGRALTCSKSMIHVKYFPYPHTGDPEKDECAEKMQND